MLFALETAQAKRLNHYKTIQHHPLLMSLLATLQDLACSFLNHEYDAVKNLQGQLRVGDVKRVAHSAYEYME